MDSGDPSDDIDPQTAAQLKAYVDDRVASVQESQEQAWRESLQAAGFNRETVENSVEKLVEHTTMGRRAALGALASGVAIGFFGGNAMAAPGDDGDTVWGSDANRDDYYADEIDANLVTATEGQYESVISDNINIGKNVSAGPAEQAELGDNGRMVVSDQFQLSDDEQTVLKLSAHAGRVYIWRIRNNDDNSGGVFISLGSGGSGGSVSIIESSGDWSTGDIDGNNCVFFDGIDVVLKNRTGAAKNYSGVVGFGTQ